MRTGIDRVITLHPESSLELLAAHLSLALPSLLLTDLTVPQWKTYGPSVYGITFHKAQGWTVGDERRLDGFLVGKVKSVFDPRADLGWVDSRVAGGEVRRRERLS
ncbi:hypothetical protein IAT38_000232 [Cryptococcus sp. DSM 104549]